MDMGHTTRDGPAHKIKACGARHCSACTTEFQEGILEIKRICSDMLDIVFFVNTYHITE